MIDFLVHFLIGMTGFLICEVCIRGFIRFRKPVRINLQWEWKDIKQVPLVGLEEYNQEILVTDGNEVRMIYFFSMSYNKKGRPVFGYDKKEITHWAFMPSAPKKSMGN